MRTSILPILLLLLPGQMLADKYLTVWQNNEEIQSFELSDGAKVSYDGGNVMFVSGRTAIAFSRSDALKFAFTDTPTGINGKTTDKNYCKFRLTDRTLHVCLGENAVASVAIYCADGSKAISGKTGTDGRWDADLSQLPYGNYIFKSKSSSFKFILK